MLLAVLAAQELVGETTDLAEILPLLEVLLPRTEVESVRMVEPALVAAMMEAVAIL